MTKAETAIRELKAQGFDDKAIMDALCDGKALESMGLGDEDQLDIEEAFSAMKTSAAAATLGRKGGQAKTEAKTAAVRENGKKGGRPKKVVDNQNQRGQI